ncbi:hypothetical protein B0I35DRAFT_348900 [Stachybotrys elegans]|uniref:Gfo/Idh/MocA-like oxidoreductase N-terminal domain-containing protein n=1 Tax=Stachybotrys elegans TaxID=80388 RepID=A0A8K0WVB0_9HYPO|nr:hypothetical protein B0I35DRAFT_348900 [Stachybotrys elegans]
MAIRVGIIGLSSSAKTSWASGAHLPYLLSPRGQSKYRIVALCNSSVEAAKRAVETYNLPPETRTYGDPKSLAEDPDVDLVVNCTRVDVHYSTILPSVKAGKNVFVEWPLAHNAQHASDLVQEAKKSGSATMVGLQGRLAPVYVKIKQILEQGRVGKILSAEIRASGGTNDREKLPPGLAYFGDRSIGGNVYTIGFGHLFDQLQHLMGDFVNLKPQLQIQRPTMKIIDPSTKEIIHSATSDVPDLIFATATLAESPITRGGASVLLRFRRGQPFPGDPHLDIAINGEGGEIRLRAMGGTALHATAYNGPVVTEVHDYKTDKVETVEWEWADWQDSLPLSARSIGMLYESFADANSKPPTFEDALIRHEQLEEMLVE